MNIKKSVKIVLFIFAIIIISIIVLYFVKSRNYATNDETNLLKEKISQEIFFLDDYIISIANSVNNINLENYVIKSETITGQSSKEKTNSNSSEKDNQSSSEGSNGSSGSGSGSSSSSNSSEGGSSASTYIMEPSDILVNARKADWQSIKIAVERLYTTWPTIIVDLYKINADTNTVRDFSNNLDELTKSVKAEDKNTTLMYLSKLYGYLNTFGSQAFDGSLDSKIIATKTNILNAYSLIEQQKWDEIRLYLQKAEDEYMNIMNNSDNKNQYNVNKAYVILKEFQSSVNTKDMEVLYIKYKTLLDELNVINI